MSFRVIDNFLSKKNYKTITKTFTKQKETYLLDGQKQIIVNMCF